MKTRFFMLLAAMLLISTNARAQISEAEIQKADVNGDGNVDVADMTSIIDIMKNLGSPNGVYKYYLGVVLDDDEHVYNQEYVNSLIQNSTMVYNGKPSVLNFPTTMYENELVLWIFDSKMGQPDLRHGGFHIGEGSFEEIGLPEPNGYKVIYRSHSGQDGVADNGFQANITWYTPFSIYEAGFEYTEGDLDNNGIVNEIDLNNIKDKIKAVLSLEGVKYGMFFISYEEEIGLDEAAFSSWIEEKLAMSESKYVCRPRKIRTQRTKEKGTYIWVYPTSLGIVERITDRSGAGTGWLSASDLGITPPQGYDFFVRESDMNAIFKIVWK